MLGKSYSGVNTTFRVPSCLSKINIHVKFPRIKSRGAITTLNDMDLQIMAIKVLIMIHHLIDEVVILQFDLHRSWCVRDQCKVGCYP